VEYLNELNPPQREAVTTVEGPIMIIAGAGSGKTRVLTYRIAFLVEQGIDPFQILALTFTNKAAREMKERISKVIGETDARSLWMGTFHSVFARILRAESDKLGYPSNFSIYDTDDAKSLLKTIINELGLDDKTYKASTVYNRISSAKNALITAAAYQKNEVLKAEDEEARRPRMAEIYALYTGRCFKASAMDFDDLLLKTYELFLRFPEVLYKYQNRFQFLLVDEFQDTNFAQYSIVKQLAALYQNICVVGDDAQSIYAFRGANIQNILDFEQDYPDLRTFKLEQNYRSTQCIVEAANHIIANNRGQIPKTVWTQNEKGNKIKLYRAMTDNEEGQFVASSIHETHLREHTPHDQFAVLYRTNAQSRALEEALRKLNVPYRIYGGLSFYHRKEIKDLLAYIRVVINPADEEALKRIINYPARGIGKTTLDKLFVAASDNDISLWEVLENIESLGLGLGVGIRAKIEDFRFMMLRFQGALMNANAYDLATEIAQNSGLLQDLYTDKSPEGVSRYENILELLNGIKEFADREENLPDGRPILPAFMEDVALLTDADETDDDNTPKVSLMTIHAAKGLEFQEVFVVGLEDSLFPNQQNMHSRAEMEEERRLFYVAITRAMKQLSISYSTTRYRYGSLVHSEASPFISELNQEYLEPVASRRPGAGGAPDPFRRNISSTFSIPAHSRLRKVSDVSKTPSTANLAADYKVGMLVKHNRFGQGKIIGIDGPAGQKTATVLFNESGEKRLLLKFAKLEIVQ